MAAGFGFHLHSESDSELEHEPKAAFQSIENESQNYDPLVERNEGTVTIEPDLEVEGNVHSRNSLGPSIELGEEANNTDNNKFCDIPVPSDEWKPSLTEIDPEFEFNVESSNEMPENEYSESETNVISDSNLQFELRQWATS